jgi:hypothetical protein
MIIPAAAPISLSTSAPEVTITRVGHPWKRPNQAASAAAPITPWFRLNSPGQRDQRPVHFAPYPFRSSSGTEEHRAALVAFDQDQRQPSHFA